jgi:hypothetical protein
MSRHTFTGNRAGIRIVVGWDRPLETYFAQVWDGGELEEGNLLLWLRTDPKQTETIEDLAAQLTPFGGLPEGVLDLLRSEADFDCHSLRSRL